MSFKAHPDKAIQVEFNPSNPQVFHRALAHFNLQRLAVSRPSPDWQQDLHNGVAWQLAEGEFIESLRADVAPFVPGNFTGGE